MEITKVTVRKISGENDKIRGIATVVLDGCFKVKGIRILEKDGSLMLAMPSRKNRNTDKNEDVAHPINPETRKMFEDVIFEEYNNVLENTEE